MKFSEIVDQATALLQRKGRLSYRALKREFELDDAVLEDLRDELIDIQEVAADKDGKMLLWTGEPQASPPIARVEDPHGAPEPPTAPLPAMTAEPLPVDAEGSLDFDGTAERRQLTVMFCDLVGSTALSEQLDPEDLRKVIRAYQETASEVITRHGGHIAQYLGDGLLVYFGYPQAHEDDARRAVQAGLEIIEALGAADAGEGGEPGRGLAVRIGIHTGLVVIGEVGGDGRLEQLALGQTPNVAARIEASAEPNTVVISVSTAHLVTGLFELEELGARQFEGLADPLEVSRAVAPIDRGDEGLSTAEGAPFLVGRDEELGLLRRRWEQSKEGLGQTVLISGEAGIGKTALSQAIEAQVIGEGYTRIIFRCSPYHRNSALYPVITHLQRVFRFSEDESSESKLHKIERLVKQFHPFQVDEVVPLIAALLSVAVPAARYAPLNVSPQQQRQRTHDALAAWMIEEAKRRPALMVWEDLHLADASTLELVGLAMDQTPTVSGMNVLTFRPDFTPPWTARSHMTPITLNRLERPQVEALVTHLTGGKTLPAQVVREIVSKTDGVPLYVEEMTKMVLEADYLDEVDDHYELTRELPALTIPSTLQDLLMARLDRWPEVREVAQLGAVFGREFAYEMLLNLSAVDESALQERLTRLVDAELLYQRGRPPRAKYFFRHALIQDAAYESLLRSVRQHYHQQIAQLFEKAFSDMVEAQPEGVAHHYTEAGLAEQAIPYWLKAGEQAVKRSANVEAVGHLTQGLDLIDSLPVTPERVQLELKLHATRGAPLVATKGYADPEVEESFVRMRELCEQLGTPPQLFPVLFRLRSFYMVRSELDKARELGDQLLRLAEDTQDPGLLLEAHYALGATLFYAGEFVSAQQHLEQTATLYDAEAHRPHSFMYGQDPKVAAHSHEAVALQRLGFLDQALIKAEAAIALAKKVQHPFSLGLALDFAATLHQFRRDAEATREQAELAISLSTEMGFPFWLAFGTIMRGWALAVQGEGDAGITLIRRGLAGYTATGAGLARTYFLCLLAEASGEAGHTEEGLGAIAEALDIAERTGEHEHETSLYRLKGDLTLNLSGEDVPTANAQATAEACYLKAIDIARSQKAKQPELQAIMSLCRLRQQQSRQPEAREMLAEIYNWFTEGFDTKDLREAKELLEELG